MRRSTAAKALREQTFPDRPGAAFLAVLAVLFGLTWSGHAAAEAILHVEGDRAADAARDLRAALAPKLHPTTSRALDTTLNERLGGATLSAALATPSRARGIATLVAEAVARAGAELALVVAVTAHGQDLHVDVLLVPAEGGAPLLQSEDMPPLEKRSERVAWWKRVFASPEHPPKRLDEPVPEAASEPPLDETPYAQAKADAAAQPAEEKAAARAPGRKEPGSTAAPHARGPLRYFFRAAFELGFRHFSDTEAVGIARVYEAFPVPGAAVSAEAYPLFGVVGFGGSFAQSFGVQSTTSDRTTVGTTFLRAEGSLRGRLNFRRTERSPFLAVFAGYLYTSFTFDSVPPDREVPTAKYQSLRFGADARIPIGRFLLMGGAEYDHVVSIGALGNAKAQAPGNGVTATLGFGFELTPWLVARADGRYTWVSYSMLHDVPAHVEDHYTAFAIGLEAAF